MTTSPALRHHPLTPAPLAQPTRWPSPARLAAGAAVVLVAGALVAGWSGVALVLALAVAALSTWLVLFTTAGIGA